MLTALPLMLLLVMHAFFLMMENRTRWKYIVATVGVCLFLLHWEVGFPQLYRGRLRGVATNYHHLLADLYIPLGKWLHNERLERGAISVALYDAGATPFYAADCHVIDILGLNDREFARNPMTPESLLSREPDYVLLKSRSVEKFVNPDDGDYGEKSNMIHADAQFQKQYELDRVWSDNRSQYIVWVYRRR